LRSIAQREARREHWATVLETPTVSLTLLLQWALWANLDGSGCTCRVNLGLLAPSALIVLLEGGEKESEDKKHCQQSSKLCRSLRGKFEMLSQLVQQLSRNSFLKMLVEIRALYSTAQPFMHGEIGSGPGITITVINVQNVRFRLVLMSSCISHVSFILDDAFSTSRSTRNLGRSVQITFSGSDHIRR
jgi:hypothetical protein